ncbi:alpha-ribazole phosphatase family protein [Psychromonas ossibalaenae]|uniref:alpha-ribazole phosphatase family protein n=1 Tax=Psychromonas ossibalaenae TaxID=444922 RepID=UPI0003778CD8|nr:alpha-ribazole phosphatase family protein [Psychromonas ossibalaenae]
MKVSKSLNIYLVRHTQPLVKNAACYGRLDLPLADCYQHHLDKISDYFKELPISFIYSSPLLRCSKLAEDLGNKRDPVVKPVLSAQLKEINFGDWEGKSWSDIPQSEIECWNLNRLHYQFPRGETPYQFHLRVIKAWKKIVSDAQTDLTAEQSIVIVAHAGVIRSILSDFLSIPFELSVKLQIDMGSISLLSFQGETSTCVFVNKSNN